MLGLNGLPRPHHPVFNVPSFALASRNRFFLCLQARDPLFEIADVRRFLEEQLPGRSPWYPRERRRCDKKRCEHETTHCEHDPTTRPNGPAPQRPGSRHGLAWPRSCCLAAGVRCTTSLDTSHMRPATSSMTARQRGRWLPAQSRAATRGAGNRPAELFTTGKTAGKLAETLPFPVDRSCSNAGKNASASSALLVTASWETAGA